LRTKNVKGGAVKSTNLEWAKTLEREKPKRGLFGSSKGGRTLSWWSQNLEIEGNLIGVSQSLQVKLLNNMREYN
jgi:hypothetical protein